MNEAETHQYIFQWLVAVLPTDCLIHHSPNEGARKPQYRAKLNALGLHAGWPDLEVFVPQAYFCDPLTHAPIFIEVKSGRGRLSPAQKETLAGLRRCGAHCQHVRSIAEVSDFITPLMHAHLLKTQGRAQMLQQLEEAKRRAA